MMEDLLLMFLVYFDDYYHQPGLHPEAVRVFFWLNFAGESYEEIAKKLNKRKSTLYTYNHVCKMKLRDTLSDRIEEEDKVAEYLYELMTDPHDPYLEIVLNE